MLCLTLCPFRWTCANTVVYWEEVVVKWGMGGLVELVSQVRRLTVLMTGASQNTQVWVTYKTCRKTQTQRQLEWATDSLTLYVGRAIVMIILSAQAIVPDDKVGYSWLSTGGVHCWWYSGDLMRVILVYSEGLLSVGQPYHRGDRGVRIASR